MKKIMHILIIIFTLVAMSMPAVTYAAMLKVINNSKVFVQVSHVIIQPRVMVEGKPLTMRRIWRRPSSEYYDVVVAPGATIIRDPPKYWTASWARACVTSMKLCGAHLCQTDDCIDYSPPDNNDYYYMTIIVDELKKEPWAKFKVIFYNPINVPY